MNNTGCETVVLLGIRLAFPNRMKPRNVLERNIY